MTQENLPENSIKTPLEENVKENNTSELDTFSPNQKSISLRLQLLYTFIPAFAIPLSCATLFAYQFISNKAETDIKYRLSNIVLLTQEIFELTMEEAFAIPITIANNPAILEAVKSGTEGAIEEKLTQLPINQVEKKFATNKLLQEIPELNSYLKVTIDNSQFSEIFVTEKFGFNVAYSNPTSDFVQRDEGWWQKARSNEKFIGNPEFDASSNVFSLPLVHSIRDPKSGDFVGVIKAIFPISYLNEIESNYLEHTSIGSSQKIQLIDVNSGRAVSTIGPTESTTDSEIIGGEKVFQISKEIQNVTQDMSVTSAEVSNMLPKDIGVEDIEIAEFEPQAGAKAFTFSFSHEDRQYTLTPISQTSFVVAASVTQDEIRATANDLRSAFLVLIIALFLIIVTAIVILARKISNPIQDLAIKAEEVVSGNLDIVVNPTGTTETQFLGNSFNRMVKTIKQSLQQQMLALQEAEEARQQAETLAKDQSQKNAAIQKELIELLEDVEEASSGNLTVRSQINAGEIGIVADFFNSIIESLRDIVGQVKQTANLVNESVDDNKSAINELATEANKQAEQIDQTLFSVEQMTSSIQQVAQNAKEAAKVANIASVKAETGGQSMDRTVSSILQLQETIDETGGKVKRLGEASQQISRVISLINQIAMQTNLLAINASIEAARAGEEGKGFAVVAEEVGQLANQSSEATKEVGIIVAIIQKEIAEVVEAMEIGTNQALEGTRLVEETKTSLQQIVEVSYQIDKLVQSISDNTISQVQTSETVTQLMKQIAQLSKRTSTASSDITNSLEETVAIAHKLQSSVDTFKV